MRWKCGNCLALFERDPTGYAMTCPICLSEDVKTWDEPPPVPYPTDPEQPPLGGGGTP